jgi:hypothetical protein
MRQHYIQLKSSSSELFHFIIQCDQKENKSEEALQITSPDMIFLTDPTMRISYTFHLLELYDTRFPYSITSRLLTRHL